MVGEEGGNTAHGMAKAWQNSHLGLAITKLLLKIAWESKKLQKTINNCGTEPNCTGN